MLVEGRVLFPPLLYGLPEVCELLLGVFFIFLILRNVLPVVCCLIADVALCLDIFMYGGGEA